MTEKTRHRAAQSLLNLCAFGKRSGLVVHRAVGIHRHTTVPDASPPSRYRPSYQFQGLWRQFCASSDFNEKESRPTVSAKGRFDPMGKKQKGNERKIRKESSGVVLTACLMVKNEEAMLSRCLASIKNHVDEIVVVDTGSTDRTVEIAESYGAKISLFLMPRATGYSRSMQMRNLLFLFLRHNNKIGWR